MTGRQMLIFFDVLEVVSKLGIVVAERMQAKARELVKMEEELCKQSQDGPG